MKPPFEPVGTMTAFFTICAFIRPEDLGAVVLEPVRPADAAARDAAAAQVDALHLRRVDEDLEQRVRLRHVRHRRRGDLERQVRAGPAGRRWCARSPRPRRGGRAGCGPGRATARRRASRRISSRSVDSAAGSRSACGSKRSSKRRTSARRDARVRRERVVLVLLGEAARRRAGGTCGTRAAPPPGATSARP